MKKTHWLLSVSIGVIVGVVVSTVITFVDWRANPGGIFRSDVGTDWAVVAETASSWFFPVAAAVSILTALVFFVFSLLRRGRGAT